MKTFVHKKGYLAEFPDDFSPDKNSVYREATEKDMQEKAALDKKMEAEGVAITNSINEDRQAVMQELIAIGLSEKTAAKLAKIPSR